uniref:RING-H2 finger protein ATL11-like n=1 Tax=Erigeron canadensis TaxID=72917 RepID=UPI001CB925BC|nr:RING-H2 finger protein ATL11-like [Erigeron canadensis]
MKMSTPMTVVLACLLTSFLLIAFFYYYFRHYAEDQLALAAATGHVGQRSSMTEAAARGLDPAVIATFTSFIYSEVKEITIGQQVLECAVCLNEFCDHESLRLLPECSHVFHRNCIDEWLAFHVTCPVCRTSLVPKPGRLGKKTESPCDLGGPTKSHVSVEVSHLKHDHLPSKKMSRSCSTGHLTATRHDENAERYMLRLTKDTHDILKSSSTNPSTSMDMSSLTECTSKTGLRSASANFLRGSSYSDYERFGQERRSGDQRSLGNTGSFNSHSISVHLGDDSMTGSQRFLASISMTSPFNRLFQLSNKVNEVIMQRLYDSN